MHAVIVHRRCSTSRAFSVRPHHGRRDCGQRGCTVEFRARAESSVRPVIATSLRLVRIYRTSPGVTSDHAGQAEGRSRRRIACRIRTVAVSVTDRQLVEPVGAGESAVLNVGCRRNMAVTPFEGPYNALLSCPQPEEPREQGCQACKTFYLTFDRGAPRSELAERGRLQRCSPTERLGARLAGARFRPESCSETVVATSSEGAIGVLSVLFTLENCPTARRSESSPATSLRFGWRREVLRWRSGRPPRCLARCRRQACPRRVHLRGPTSQAVRSALFGMTTES